MPEFKRLKIQKCPYCDGWGHSGNDCPTDAKIKHLRGGVREQNRFLQLCRKKLRKESGMADKTGFSLLSAAPMRGSGKRTRKELIDDTISLNDTLYAKRRNFP